MGGDEGLARRCCCVVVVLLLLCMEGGKEWRVCKPVLWVQV